MLPTLITFFYFPMIVCVLDIPVAGPNMAALGVADNND